MLSMKQISYDSRMIFLKGAWGQKVKEREGYDRQGHFSLRRKKHDIDRLLVKRGLFSGNTSGTRAVVVVIICQLVPLSSWRKSSLIKISKKFIGSLSSITDILFVQTSSILLSFVHMSDSRSLFNGWFCAT